MARHFLLTVTQHDTALPVQLPVRQHDTALPVLLPVRQHYTALCLVTTLQIPRHGKRLSLQKTSFAITFQSLQLTSAAVFKMFLTS